MGFLPAQQALGMHAGPMASIPTWQVSTNSTATRHKTPPVEGQMTAKMTPV